MDGRRGDTQMLRRSRLQGRNLPSHTEGGHPRAVAAFTGAAPRRYLPGVRPPQSNQIKEHLRYGSIIRQFAGLALRHPRLIPPLLSAAWRFRRRDWFRHPPYLPVPPADYVAWRLHTAYGTEDAIPPAADLRRYLDWTAAFRHRR